MTAQAADYQVDVCTFGRGNKDHVVECVVLGIREDYHGSYEDARSYGRRLVERHLMEHGPVPVERPRMTAEEINDVFGGY